MSTPEEALRAAVKRQTDFQAALRQTAADLDAERRREEEATGRTVPAGEPELEQKGGG